MSYRMLLDYPPAAHMLSILASGQDEELLEKGMEFLRKFAERISPGKELHIIGPAWASVGKVNDVYRKVLYMKHAVEKGMEFLRKFAERISPGKELHIIGPAWASVGKVNDVYRKVLYMKHAEEKVLMDMKNKIGKYIEINSGFRKLYIMFDYQ